MKTDLIVVTGIWHLLLCLASERESNRNKILWHFSHRCNKDYNDNFEFVAKQLCQFKEIRNIGNCIYIEASEEGYNNGNLAEIDNKIAKSKFEENLRNEEIDEVYIPHYFSPKMRALVETLPNSKFICVEEGLNSYYRAYNKKLNELDLFFTKKVQEIFFVEYLGLKHIFPYQRYGVKIKKIQTDKIKYYISRIKPDYDAQHIITNRAVLLIGQYANNDTEIALLLHEYVKIITRICSKEISIIFKPHPRDDGFIANILKEEFGSQIVILNSKTIIECFCQKEKEHIVAVISIGSTASVSIPFLFNIPSFYVGDESIKIGKSDLINAGNFCKAVLPNVNELLDKIDRTDSKTVRDLISQIYNEKKSTFSEVQSIYLGRNVIKQEYVDLYTSDKYFSLCYDKQKGILNWKDFFLGIRLRPFSSITYKKATKILRNYFIDRDRFSESPFSLNNTIITINKAEKENKKRLWGIAFIRLLNAPFKLCSNYKIFYLIIHNKIKRYISKHRDTLVSKAFYGFEEIRLKIESILKCKKNSTSNQDIGFLTYHPCKGPFGGPGGVLYLQREILGKTYKDRLLDYKFRTNETYIDVYADLLSGTKFAFDYVMKNSRSLYVTHDLGTAYGLALNNVPFIVFWHFQGSLITQQENFGETIPNWIKKRIARMEEYVFKKAKRIVFPSSGSLEMYRTDSYVKSYDYDQKTLVIYNTSLPELKKPDLSKSIISTLSNDDAVKVVSCGTLTKAKGQDLALELLMKVANLTDKKIIYLIIGSGVLKSDLENQALKAPENLKIIFLEKVPHENVCEIFRLSDIYLMTHRISIFDIATLEAMKANCALILSKIGGNLDFNKENNVVFSENVNEIINLISNRNFLNNRKELNAAIFAKYFGPAKFLTSNHSLLE